MAGPINQARAKISKIFNGEPQSYTRFNLTQNVDGESSHVEVKLSGDGEEEMDGTEAGHGHPASTYRLPQRPLRPYRNVCYGALVVLLIFLAGYLIGYVTHRKPEASKLAETGPGACTTDQPDGNQEEGVIAVAPEPSLDWSDLTSMLQRSLLSSAFDNQLRNFAMDSHEAGSSGDEVLANKVLDIFKSLDMNPWIDEHYVQLQMPPPSNPNKVLFGSDEIGPTKGYLAYSAKGTKEGKVVYANYGQNEDLKYLRTAGLDLTEKIVLMRTGQISLAEKVANAAKFNASAVLIYTEPPFNSFDTSTDLYGHVHFGTGDPYTPGFPSFNHTQFPPAKSSGLPEILAQTITADMALKIHQKMGGSDAPEHFKGKLKGISKYRLGGDGDKMTVTVNNALVDTKIHNVFGVIKGFIDPDHYVVMGAQRDSFSKGYAKSTVGTCLLVELARAIAEMTKAGFRPRRSIVFASWSAGDYGSVGATEWLEGYLSSLDKKAFTYISLDGVVQGQTQFRASASPLLHSLLKDTLNELKTVSKYGDLFQFSSPRDFENTLETMRMEDGAYPFLAFSGIPSISFRFGSDRAYGYFGTALDNKANLDIATGQQLGNVCVSAAQVAGQMALRLVHDHILRLDVTSYTRIIRKHVVMINSRVNQLKHAGTMSAPLSPKWLMSAVGSYSRAADSVINEIQNSDLEDQEKCRTINNRIMRVEHNLLSQYVSPRDVPFRHIIFGTGDHTVSALTDHLKDLKEQVVGSDADLLRNQFALTTWTIQSCANDLAGDVWALDNEI
ncbi:transferrin receptor 1b [Colossoma macropomum]|uniref:transferrin receptor 1b n=1 Tax=Colossoma macropomum TaxID=42526 RepID=UPI0018655B95|nr:transferrin receptor 1b [Colossoma macropomum]XP_036414253.1 transferrin receptor 1b [Colossoma macropomum]